MRSENKQINQEARRSARRLPQLHCDSKNYSFRFPSLPMFQSFAERNEMKLAIIAALMVAVLMPIGCCLAGSCDVTIAIYPCQNEHCNALCHAAKYPYGWCRSFAVGRGNAPCCCEDHWLHVSFAFAIKYVYLDAVSFNKPGILCNMPLLSDSWLSVFWLILRIFNLNCVL